MNIEQMRKSVEWGRKHGLLKQTFAPVSAAKIVKEPKKVKDRPLNQIDNPSEKSYYVQSEKTTP